MKIVASAALLLFASAVAYAEGPKPCEELKSEIAKKLEANGAKAYTLEIVAKGKDAEGKVVGSCEAGTKKIVYSKASVPPKASAPTENKPKP
ncbi:MAG: DUF1161 domain-containing protein [Terracidiphilus sp.]|jgi:hypothetical protein